MTITRVTTLGLYMIAVAWACTPGQNEDAHEAQSDEQPPNEVVSRFDVMPADIGSAAHDVVGADVDVTQSLEVLSEPCLAVTPRKVFFGGKSYGSIVARTVKIESCNDATQRIVGIRLTEESSPRYLLDFSSLGVPPTLSSPLLIGAGSSTLFDVLFSPLGSGEETDDCTAEERGTIFIELDGSTDTEIIELSGTGASMDYPTPVISIEESGTLEPYTTVHLVGNDSYSSDDATIVSWNWAAIVPDGSYSAFVPSYTFPKPSYPVGSAGTYVFSLAVVDSLGVASCVPSEYTVQVVEPTATE